MFRPQLACAFRTSSDSSEVESDEAAAWRGVVQLSVSTQGLPPIPAPRTLIALEAALETWRAPACTEVAIASVQLTERPASTGDGYSVVQWVADDWTKSGFDSEVPAITDLVYADVDGGQVIVEADIYLNAEHHEWTLDEEPPAHARHLVAVLTHEVGHVLGLLHSCELDTDIDPNAPLCGHAESLEPVSMHPAYNFDQISLESDDIDGICFLYPARSEDVADATGPFRFTQTTAIDGGVGLDIADVARQSNCEGEPSCIAQPADFGLPCDKGEPAQCSSGHCLDSFSGNAVCTRECRPGHACPHGWRCQNFDDRAVCVPSEPAGHCAVGSLEVRDAESRSITFSGAIVVGCLLALRYRRRRGG